MEWILRKKDGKPVTVLASVRKATLNELESLFEMQNRIRAQMDDPEQFIPNEKEELRDNILNNLVIGVWVAQTPIAMGIVRYDGNVDTNYAHHFNVPQGEIAYWANADTVVVDPKWRGNGLQQRLVELFFQWRRPNIVGMGCTVSPKNQFSLNNMLASGFEIESRAQMYGKHDRYLLSRRLPPLPGKYKHFKGGEYRVLGLAQHSETQEPMVIYQALYGECGIWVRPVSMWFEYVEKPNYAGPRFMYVGE